VRTPRTLSEFKTEIQKNFRANSDEDGFGKADYLKAYLIESNSFDVPIMDKFNPWKKLENSINWYVSDSQRGYFVLNKTSDRIWTLYTTMSVSAADAFVAKWMKSNINLDNCWISKTQLQNFGKKQKWTERGIGVRYNDLFAESDKAGRFSMKVWYGNSNSVVIKKELDRIKKEYSITSIRWNEMNNGSTSMTSEWYTNGKITIKNSENPNDAFQKINEMSGRYLDSITEATKMRDKNNNSFEFEFKQKINLEKYTEATLKAKKNLKLWLMEINSDSDFKRYSGIDTHTWDGIYLDLASNYAYMNIPKGCVNAAPRFATIQGSEIAGDMKIYYDGVEIFV